MTSGDLKLERVLCQLVHAEEGKRLVTRIKGDEDNVGQRPPFSFDFAKLTR